MRNTSGWRWAWTPQGSYGGYKHSGSGRTGGLEGLQEFQQVENIRIGLS